MQLGHELLLGIFWKWDWKFSDCNLDTMKTERNGIKLISRIYQNFHIWSLFWNWNRWHHTFCLAMKYVCDVVSKTPPQGLWIFLLVHQVFLCYLTDEITAFTVKLKEMFPPFPYPILWRNLSDLSIHLKSTWTLFCGCTAPSTENVPGSWL